MDITRQSVRAQNMHTTYLASRERTCIDCHKGIAHRLPLIPAGQIVADTPGQAVPRDAIESQAPSASSATR
jgi:cytochrome c-type protein NapC